MFEAVEKSKFEITYLRLDICNFSASMAFFGFIYNFLSLLGHSRNSSAIELVPFKSSS